MSEINNYLDALELQAFSHPLHKDLDKPITSPGITPKFVFKNYVRHMGEANKKPLSSLHLGNAYRSAIAAHRLGEHSMAKDMIDGIHKHISKHKGSNHSEYPHL